MKHHINTNHYCSKCGMHTLALTTICAGKPIHDPNRKLVAEGKLDYTEAGWVNVSAFKPDIKSPTDMQKFLESSFPDCEIMFIGDDDELEISKEELSHDLLTMMKHLSLGVTNVISLRNAMHKEFIDTVLMLTELQNSGLVERSISTTNTDSGWVLTEEGADVLAYYSKETTSKEETPVHLTINEITLLVNFNDKFGLGDFSDTQDGYKLRSLGLIAVDKEEPMGTTFTYITDKGINHLKKLLLVPV